MSSKMVGPPYALHSPDARMTVSPHFGGSGNRTVIVLPDCGPRTRCCLEAGDALLDAVGHRRLGRLRTEPVDHGLQPVDLLGLQHRLLGEAGLVLGSRPLVLAVGAAVLDDLADVGLGGPVEVEHPGDRLVEQFEVVADHQQRALVLAQESEQPGLGVDVEVVGRLVETQHVGAGEQDAGQLDPAALAARQRADRLIEAGIGDPESRRHRPCFALGGVATVGPERLLCSRCSG